jgi:hypothetical protein
LNTTEKKEGREKRRRKSCKKEIQSIKIRNVS